MVPMRFVEKVQKNLLLALALILALSSFGGASALAWVHADGSLCFTCPLDEPAPAAVDECCPPGESEAVVSATDCQICCQAEGHEQSHRKVLPVHAAVLLQQPMMVQVFRIQAGVFPTQRTLARKTAPYSLPSFRAPPV